MWRGGGGGGEGKGWLGDGYVRLTHYNYMSLVKHPTKKETHLFKVWNFLENY